MIKVTGHSLGAAVAQLTGMTLIKQGLNVHMINFGQPRVGDTNYANFSNSIFATQLRITHNQDPVVRIPAPVAGYLYRHTRFEIFEDAAGNVKKCNLSGEDMTCAD